MNRGGATQLFAIVLSVACLLPSMADEPADASPAKADSAAAKPIDSAFDSATITFAAKPGNVGHPITWKFTNHWDFPLAVERIHISCGCLSSPTKAADIAPVEPGKSGEIDATFTPGPYRGTLRKSLHVYFAGHPQPVELVAEARIPSSVELTTSELTWTPDSAETSHTLDITAGTETDITITDLVGVPENHYRIEQSTLTEGRHHRLTITPTADTPPGITTLQIRTDSPDPRDQIKAIFLNFKG